MAEEIQIRRDTAANWTSVNPILAQGEIGLETDTNQIKFGNGVNDWAGLAYFGGSGNPFDQTLNTTDAVVFDKVTLTGPIIETQTAVSSSAGMVLLDCDLGNVFTLDLTENVITLNITNIPLSGLAMGITLVVTADGTQRTIAWPASFRWAGGVAPTITATINKCDVFVFFTYDNGYYFKAFTAGQNL